MGKYFNESFLFATEFKSNIFHKKTKYYLLISKMESVQQKIHEYRNQHDDCNCNYNFLEDVS